MAKDKKSFVAYADWLESFEELSDEEAGKLVKHLFRYINDMEPEAPDKLTKMCFIPIKQSLKRDLSKYEAIKDRNKQNGKKGGRPKKPTGLSGFQEKPKKADSGSGSGSDSVSDSVSVNVNVSDTPPKGGEEEEPTPTPIRSIKRIVLDYKQNERLVNAVLNSRENLFFSQQDLFDKLDDFVDHLTTIDQTAKKEHDFKSHFLNWTRAQKRKSPVKEIDYDKLFEDED